MTKGFTEVASVVVLKAVRIIQRKGVSIVIETRIRMRCTKILVRFLFLSRVSIIPS